jgi:hypothetical protein
MAGCETAIILTLQLARKQHLQWPVTLMAILSAILLSAGVLRHYYDIYVHRTVRGISFIFVGIDAAGDLFSLLSLIFQPSLNTLGMAIYGTELILWMGIFLCGAYFNLLPWIRKRLRKREMSTPNHGRESRGSLETERQTGDSVMLHSLPSSTSVFRTPSMNHAIARIRASE